MQEHSRFGLAETTRKHTEHGYTHLNSSMRFVLFMKGWNPHANGFHGVQQQQLSSAQTGIAAPVQLYSRHAAAGVRVCVHLVCNVVDNLQRLLAPRAAWSVAQRKHGMPAGCISGQLLLCDIVDPWGWQVPCIRQAVTLDQVEGGVV